MYSCIEMLSSLLPFKGCVKYSSPTKGSQHNGRLSEVLLLSSWTAKRPQTTNVCMTPWLPVTLARSTKSEAGHKKDTIPKIIKGIPSGYKVEGTALPVTHFQLLWLCPEHTLRIKTAPQTSLLLASFRFVG